MFRQRYYKNNENNSLMYRLEHLNDNYINYNTIKFWDIDNNAWVDCDNLMHYKIQKEVQINDDLIFYIYLEDYHAEE